MHKPVSGKASPSLFPLWETDPRTVSSTSSTHQSVFSAFHGEEEKPYHNFGGRTGVYQDFFFSRGYE